MSMLPFFPSLKPLIANHIWFDIDTPVNEEAEVVALEREQKAWLNSIKNAAADLYPIGKLPALAGPETDEEDPNDDSDDTESHDDEDEDGNILPSSQQSQRDRVNLGGSDSPIDDSQINDEVV